MRISDWSSDVRSSDLIEDKISGFAGCRPAICEVPSSPDGPDRQSEAVGDGKDPLHLFDDFRRDGGRRKQTAIGKRRISVAVSRHRKLVDEHPDIAAIGREA